MAGSISARVFPSEPKPSPAVRFSCARPSINGWRTVASLHDIELLRVLKKLDSLLEKLNLLADDELSKRGIGEASEVPDAR